MSRLSNVHVVYHMFGNMSECHNFNTKISIGQFSSICGIAPLSLKMSMIQCREGDLCVVTRGGGGGGG